MEHVVETDPEEWYITRHARDRFRERYGGTISTVPVIRELLLACDEWEHLAGDLNAPGSKAKLRSPQLPGVVLIVGINEQTKKPALVTILSDGPPRPVFHNRTKGMTRRWRDPSGRGERGRTSVEKRLAWRYAEIGD